MGCQKRLNNGPFTKCNSGPPPHVYPVAPDGDRWNHDPSRQASSPDRSIYMSMYSPYQPSPELSPLREQSLLREPPSPQPRAASPASSSRRRRMQMRSRLFVLAVVEAAAREEAAAGCSRQPTTSTATRGSFAPSVSLMMMMSRAEATRALASCVRQMYTLFTHRLCFHTLTHSLTHTAQPIAHSAPELDLRWRIRRLTSTFFIPCDHKQSLRDLPGKDGMGAACVLTTSSSKSSGPNSFMSSTDSTPKVVNPARY